MWQQPCAICGYYPQWWDDAKIMARTGKDPHEHLKNCTDKDTFCRRVNAAGNILEFYLKEFHKCVDPQYDKLEDARQKASGLTWPAPEEIWDHFGRDDIDHLGHKVKACGNSYCKVSTGIHDGLTFGRGKLDDLHVPENGKRITQKMVLVGHLRRNRFAQDGRLA